MSYRGHVENGIVVLDEPANLSEGDSVKIDLFPKDNREPTLGEKLMKYAGKVRGLPSDLSRQHDHYLYGVPRK